MKEGKNRRSKHVVVGRSGRQKDQRIEKRKRSRVRQNGSLALNFGSLGFSLRILQFLFWAFLLSRILVFLSVVLFGFWVFEFCLNFCLPSLVSHLFFWFRLPMADRRGDKASGKMGKSTKEKRPPLHGNFFCFFVGLASRL